MILCKRREMQAQTPTAIHYYRLHNGGH